MSLVNSDLAYISFLPTGTFVNDLCSFFILVKDLLLFDSTCPRILLADYLYDAIL